MNKTTEMTLEATVGGSFLDDLMGHLGYPANVEWYEDATRVEAVVGGMLWRRNKAFDDDSGEYLEEWEQVR